jgi:hypothetical protein
MKCKSEECTRQVFQLGFLGISWSRNPCNPRSAYSNRPNEVGWDFKVRSAWALFGKQTARCMRPRRPSAPNPDGRSLFCPFDQHRTRWRPNLGEIWTDRFPATASRRGAALGETLPRAHAPRTRLRLDKNPWRQRGIKRKSRSGRRHRKTRVNSSKKSRLSWRRASDDRCVWAAINLTGGINRTWQPSIMALGCMRRPGRGRIEDLIIWHY